MKKIPLLIVALAAASSVLPAHAQTAYPPPPSPALTGPYAGALLGRSQAKAGCIGVISGGGRECDAVDPAYGFFAGYQGGRHFGGELGYTNLGKVTASATPASFASSQEVAARIWDIAAVGILPLARILPLSERLSAFARFGFYRATLEASQRGVEEHSNAGWAYGAGLQFDVNRKIGVRGLWQRYKNVGGGDYLKGNYDVLGLSAFYRFE